MSLHRLTNQSLSVTTKRCPAPFCVVLALILASGCAVHPRKPCSQGGEPARTTAGAQEVPAGKKKCTQIKNEFGKYVNDGKYYEWYPNDKLAVMGEYKKGKKIGRWVEYDPSGNKISDSYFDNGKEASRP